MARALNTYRGARRNDCLRGRVRGTWDRSWYYGTHNLKASKRQYLEPTENAPNYADGNPRPRRYPYGMCSDRGPLAKWLKAQGGREYVTRVQVEDNLAVERFVRRHVNYFEQDHVTDVLWFRPEGDSPNPPSMRPQP